MYTVLFVYTMLDFSISPGVLSVKTEFMKVYEGACRED